MASTDAKSFLLFGVNFALLAIRLPFLASYLFWGGRPDNPQWALIVPFQSTFRNWAAVKTSCPREVCEHAFAHQLPDKVEAAYLRSDLLGKQRDLMEVWARFCLGTGTAGRAAKTPR